MRAHLYQVLKIVLEFTRVFQMNLANGVDRKDKLFYFLYVVFMMMLIGN